MVAELCVGGQTQTDGFGARGAPQAIGPIDPGSRTDSARPLSRPRAQGASDAAVIDWRGFHDALRRAALSATQRGTPLSLLMLELPGRVRDERPAGTEPAPAPIHALAGLIAAEAGEGSALARYAAERLAVILMATGLGEAIVCAERIGRSLCSADPAAPARPAIGVAEFHDDEALGHLIERAEAALDRARCDGTLIAVAGRRARSATTRPSWATL